MIGVSGESWHHKNTLSPVPSSQEWTAGHPPFYYVLG